MCCVSCVVCAEWLCVLCVLCLLCVIFFFFFFFLPVTGRNALGAKSAATLNSVGVTLKVLPAKNSQVKDARTNSAFTPVHQYRQADTQ